MDLSDIAVEQPVPIQPSAIDVTDHPEIFSLYSKEAIIKLAAKVPLVKLYWSRSKWDKLTETQRVVCSTAWRSIDDETKSAWEKEIEAAKAPKISAVLSTDSLCNPNTNIHDKARLLHLLRDPAYASTWSFAHHVMNRSELDDKQSPPQHWNKLAAAFNDYDGVTYRNATIIYSSEGAELCSYSGMGVAYEVCHTINPSSKNRPERDGEWVKKTLRAFKGDWSKVYERYRYQSGDQDAEDPYAEFAKFYAGDSILMYAFVVFENDDGVVDLMGKVCPEDSIRDTGIYGEAREKSNTSTISRKRGKHGQGEHSETEEKKFVLRMINEKTAGETDGKLAAMLTAEQDEAQLSTLVLNTPNITTTMQTDALEALAQIQLLKKKRRLAREQQSYGTPDPLFEWGASRESTRVDQLVERPDLTNFTSGSSPGEIIPQNF